MGSSPFASSKRSNGRRRQCGGVPEWSKGADCKSAGARLRRFETSPLHQPSTPCNSASYTEVPQRAAFTLNGRSWPRFGPFGELDPLFLGNPLANSPSVWGAEGAGRTAPKWAGSAGESDRQPLARPGGPPSGHPPFRRQGQKGRDFAPGRRVAADRKGGRLLAVRSGRAVYGVLAGGLTLTTSHCGAHGPGK